MSGLNPVDYLAALGPVDDREIDLARTALYVAALQHPGISLQRYEHHLGVLVQDVASAHETLLRGGDDDTAETQVVALKSVLADRHGYAGDTETYDNLQNADLISVIDRAKGLPITLAILYIHAARAQGWDIAGLNVPGHFVCRIQKDGRRLIFDPFYGAGIIDAPQIRTLVKNALGPEAELSATYFEPASNRDILLRLQNNIKLRQIKVEDYMGALETIDVMRSVCPQEYRLLLDAGVLYSKTDQPIAAIEALESYIEKAPDPDDRYEASLLLRMVRENLH
jgi:regulator of sirC expression with transglutaminase-like and TPR domain